MKKALIIIALLALAGCGGKHFEPWSPGTKFLCAAGATAHLADWGTTRQMPLLDYKVNGAGVYECNPLMGRYPSVDEVDAFMTGTLIAKILVTDYLDPKYRTGWQLLWLSINVWGAANNYSNGLRMEF